MSTPSGKPFDPIRISDYAPKRVRDRLAAQRKSADQGVQQAEPEKAAEEAPLETLAAERSDAQRPSLAPVGPHERPREERESSREDGEQERERERQSAHAAAYEDADEDEYSDEYARPAESAHARPSAQGAYAAHSEAYAVDLRRLETDLEALQRGGGEEPLPRDKSEDVAREPGEAPLRGQRRPRDTYIDGLRLPRSLEPSYLPPPPMRDRTNHLGAVLRVLIACVVAAPITYFLVYYFSAGREAPPTERGPRLTAVETQLATLPPMPAAQPREAPPQVQAPPPPVQAPPPPAQAWQPPAPAPQAPIQAPPQRPASFSLQNAAPNWPAAGETRAAAAAPANQAPVPPPAPAPVRPAVTLDADEIAILLKQGEQFIAAGDVVTARVPFERAAEAGDARAALALGATYDPAVLTRLGVRGIAADVARARIWYEKARALGSAEAAGRLANLASR